jgi:hypothetical protein
VAVSEERPSDVLGALPRRRPQRRSAKRAAPAETANGNGTKPAATKIAPRARKPAAAKSAPPANQPEPPSTAPRATARRPKRLPQPAQPAGVPPTSHGRPADQPAGRHLLGTAAQAAAELAEIGLSASARALRGVVDRLPRP